MPTHPSAELIHWRERFDLQPHPEGGYFKETYRSTMSLNSPAVAQQRSALTDIYYALDRGDTSAFHVVEHDEIWHHYAGGCLHIFLLNPSTLELEVKMIGPEAKDGYKVVVPAGFYQAAEAKTSACLMGCNVAPGFDFKDFAFLRDHHDRMLKDGSSSILDHTRQTHPELSHLI